MPMSVLGIQVHAQCACILGCRDFNFFSQFLGFPTFLRILGPKCLENDKKGLHCSFFTEFLCPFQGNFQNVYQCIDKSILTKICKDEYVIGT
jgi:hypothetical protein